MDEIELVTARAVVREASLFSKFAILPCPREGGCGKSPSLQYQKPSVSGYPGGTEPCLAGDFVYGWLFGRYSKWSRPDGRHPYVTCIHLC